MINVKWKASFVTVTLLISWGKDVSNHTKVIEDIKDDNLSQKSRDQKGNGRLSNFVILFSRTHNIIGCLQMRWPITTQVLSDYNIGIGKAWFWTAHVRQVYESTDWCLLVGKASCVHAQPCWCDVEMSDCLQVRHKSIHGKPADVLGDSSGSPRGVLGGCSVSAYCIWCVPL